MTQQTFFLKPGAIFVSRDQATVHTVLGSCVSVCIWDRVNGVGGMNHFIYHHATENARNCRYGDVSIPYLIKLLIESGGDIRFFCAHLVGGSQSLIPDSDVGAQNAALARDMLREYGIELQTVDIGGNSFRKVVFNNLTGEINIKKGEI